jgi:hypothetical protein
MTTRDFILLTASKPPMILDRRSWLEAAGERWDCESYRFGDIYVRSLGSTAIFAAPLELKATMDGRDWSGIIWLTDLWRRTMTRKGWKMTQRILSRIDDDREMPKAIKSLQLWK